MSSSTHDAYSSHLLPTAEKDDHVRLSADEFRRVYEEGFRSWSAAHAPGSELSVIIFSLQNALSSGPPCLRRDMRLKCERRGGANDRRLCASGHTTWGLPWISRCRCFYYGGQPFQLPVEMDVAVKQVATVDISPAQSSSSSSQDDPSRAWSRGKADCVAILALAWAYVLSARWVETMPGSTRLEYCAEPDADECGDDGDDDSEPIFVDIGDMCDQDEARWWSAVLAQGRGWQATTTFAGESFSSPWSRQLVCHQSTRFQFVFSPHLTAASLTTRATPTTKTTAVVEEQPDGADGDDEACFSHHHHHHHRTGASYKKAKEYLARFCTRHDIADQALAALATIVLFPFCSGGASSRTTLQLPMIAKPTHHTQEAASSSSSSSYSFSAGEGQEGKRSGWWRRRWSAGRANSLLDDADLDKVLTLSCHTRGVRAILLSVFYEPGIDCRAASAWLQGSLAAVDNIIIPASATDQSLVLASMMMRRSSNPFTAFLWLGASMLGLHKKLITEARRGQIPIDLASAAWSGTTQTFLQRPTTRILDSSNGSSSTCFVSRADECRLLFLCHPDSHKRLPLVQWQPFGATPLEDTDLDVRNHSRCGMVHQLQYLGFAWSTEAGGPILPFSQLQTRLLSLASSLATHLRLFVEGLLWRRSDEKKETRLKRAGCAGITTFTRVSYGAMNMNREAISENATRNIFMWLRVDGYTRHERSIWSHEWFDVFEDDEKEAEAIVDESHSECSENTSLVQRWLSNLQ